MLPVTASAGLGGADPTPVMAGIGAVPAVVSRLRCGDGVAPRSGPQVAAGKAVQRWGRAGDVVDVVTCSTVPAARGLGSSAACAAAAVLAVADLYDRTIDAEGLYELVQCGEQVAHGRASGIDARTVTVDPLECGPVWFLAGEVSAIAMGCDASWVIADTGVASQTEDAVAAVRAVFEQDPMWATRVLGKARALVTGAAHDVRAGDITALGHKLVIFQGVLAELGVSTPALDRLVAAALDAGALGAKLTGGGLGGCILGLTRTPGDAARVRSVLERAGATSTWTIRTRGDTG